MLNLETYVKNLLSSQTRRVQNFSFEGQRYWLKQVPQKPNLKDHLRKNTPQQLQCEIEAIQFLIKQGAPVASLVMYGPHFLVLEDTGETLDKWLIKPELNRVERESLLKTATEALARLHTRGLFHGRPALRDITWDGKKIHFIDWEHFAIHKISDRQKVRDLLIFIHGFYRGKVPAHLDEEMIQQAMKTYRQAGGEKTWLEAQALCQRHRWLFSLLKFYRNKGGPNNDIRPIWYVFRHFLSDL